jgi:uncharacterized membrane protein
MRVESIPFRPRGHEVSRIEAFSDVVFGFALTLIVVSLEVPKSFEELMEVMGGFIAFAICFAMLTWIWWVHHVFFRRYALRDDLTIVLNMLLLFLVLFYTYPLKFLFSLVTGQIHDVVRSGTIFVIYGLGFAGIFAVFFLLYLHALRKTKELDLNALEVHDTKSAMLMYAAYVGIGALSALIGATATGRALNWAGWCYFLLGPVSAFIGFRRGAERDRLQVATVDTEP